MDGKLTYCKTRKQPIATLTNTHKHISPLPTHSEKGEIFTSHLQMSQNSDEEDATPSSLILFLSESFILRQTLNLICDYLIISKGDIYFASGHFAPLPLQDWGLPYGRHEVTNLACSCPIPHFLAPWHLHRLRRTTNQHAKNPFFPASDAKNRPKCTWQARYNFLASSMQVIAACPRWLSRLPSNLGYLVLVILCFTMINWQQGGHASGLAQVIIAELYTFVGNKQTISGLIYALSECMPKPILMRLPNHWAIIQLLLFWD